jgi:fermentation-respiration switch protein FrsA (DUF1100 family)
MLESLVNRFIYYPDPHWIVTPADLGLKAEDVLLRPEPGVQLHAWFFPQPQPPGVSAPLRSGMLAQSTVEPPGVSTPLHSPWHPLAPDGATAGVTEPRQVGMLAQSTAEPPVVSTAELLATLLFCHGNAGNVSHRLENVAYLLRSGFQVLLFDYRGYGHSSGQPSEQGLYRDAATAWAHLAGRTDTTGAPRVIFGRSLGGAVAVDLATRAEGVEADALIIESTFTSVRALTRLVLPFPLPELPVKYDSLSKIGQLKMPLLVIHGERDELIPFAEGRALFEAAPQPKTWYPIRGAGHNDTYLVGEEAYFRRLATFVSDLPGAQN